MSRIKKQILNKLKEYANKMGRDHLGGDDYTSKKKGGLRDFDGYDNVDYNKDMPMDEMQVVNKKTGKDITKHVLALLSGKIDKKKFEKLTGLKKESVTENRFAKKPEVTPKQLSQIQADIKRINRKIKVYISKHPVTKGRLEIELGHGHDNDAEIDKIYSVMKKRTGDWRTGSMFNESVNEAYVVLYSPKKGVKPVTTAAYKDKKDAEKWAKDLGGITMIVKKKVKGIDESVNEAMKPSQIRSAISKVKKQLMRKWKQNGGYENFGQKELDKMKSKFDYNPYGSSDERQISKMLDGFDNWAMNYDGNMREDISEAKVKRPVNRWLELKNDESMHPHKKMAMGLKELKYQLRETEKFFNWYNKIKTMNELDSNQYWKRTNSHIYKIKERLINIARTIQEIEK